MEQITLKEDFNMKSYCIVIKTNITSENAFNCLVNSSNRVKNTFTIERFDAITPDNLDKTMKDLDIVWNYPWGSSVYDEDTKMRKIPYSGREQKSRIACGVSHYLLWEKCAESTYPFLILEHDSEFIEQLPYQEIINESGFEIIGLNHPKRATRNWDIFNNMVQSNPNKYQKAPQIDKTLELPQGLAGNSAYIITPSGAKKLVDLVKKYGLWPNDAIMCIQLLDTLGVTKTYYTKVQNINSTTSR